MLKRISGKRQFFLSFLCFVAQALGYKRNGIIKISVVLNYFISLVEKGVNHFVIMPRIKKGEPVYGHANLF